MTSLYNCRHDGDQYRITKWDSDFNVESSYLCTLVECECPAGHRDTCRHRQMLPKFIAREAVGTDWFYDFDRGGWVHQALPGAGFNLVDIAKAFVETHEAIANMEGVGNSPAPQATICDRRGR